jgi:hypothetical protein
MHMVERTNGTCTSAVNEERQAAKRQRLSMHT